MQNFGGTNKEYYGINHSQEVVAHWLEEPTRVTEVGAIFDLNSAKGINPIIVEKQNFKKWRSIAIFGHFAKASKAK